MEMDRYGFKRSDIIRVIHLIDTDGAFIPNVNVAASDVEKLQYEENRIVAKLVPQTIACNERKQRVLHRLYPAKKVGGSPYAAYYFSRNLEHVIDFLMSVYPVYPHVRIMRIRRAYYIQYLTNMVKLY